MQEIIAENRHFILKKIRHRLPLKYRLLFYNAMLRHVMAYVNLVWSSCDKHCLNRVLKLQERAASIILNADFQVSCVKLFITSLSGYLFMNRPR